MPFLLTLAPLACLTATGCTDRPSQPRNWSIGLAPLAGTGSTTQTVPLVDLHPADRHHLRGIGGRRRIVEAGDLSLLMSATRASSVRPVEGERAGFSRYSLVEAAMDMKLALSDDMALSVGGNLARMKRRAGGIPIDIGARYSNIARAGVGVEHGAMRLGVGWLAIDSERASGMQRMEDLMGGAPMGRSGMEFTLATRADATSAPALSWSLAAGAMRVDRRDRTMAAARADRMDRRATLSLSLAI